MHRESYEAGFCKAAQDAGVNPDVLVKVALNINSDSISEFVKALADGYRSLDPEVRQGLVGGLAGSLGTFALSNGNLGDRLLKALAVGGLSGLGTYGLSRSGYWNKGIDWAKNNIDKLKLPKARKPLVFPRVYGSRA